MHEDRRVARLDAASLETAARRLQSVLGWDVERGLTLDEALATTWAVEKVRALLQVLLEIDEHRELRELREARELRERLGEK